MTRTADFPIEALILERWSPRAMSGEPLTAAEISRLFEAARWAPSCANSQPWRFVYGLAGTPAFAALFNLLADGNKPWCARAGALVVVVSKNTMDNGQQSPTHRYDTGAGWMALALQGRAMNLVVHGMAGFDYERARDVIALPSDHTVEAMIAIGHPGSLEDLPEKYRSRETPSQRKPMQEFIFEGNFNSPGLSTQKS